MRSSSYHSVGEALPIVEEWDYAPDHGNYGNSTQFVIRHQDGNGNETTAQYFPNGNVESRTFPVAGATESFTYNG